MPDSNYTTLKMSIVKRNKIIFFCFCCLMGMSMLVSCSEGLDVKSTVEMEDDYFTSEMQIQNGVGAVYAALANIYGPSNENDRSVALYMLPGDDLRPRDGGSYAAFEAFVGLSSSSGAVERFWKTFYWLVYRANFMLEKIEEPAVKAVYVTDGLYEYNRGELLFLRAWAFSKLWDYFGKAPLQHKRIRTVKEGYLPPSSGTQLIDNAIANLEDAARLLPLPDYWKDGRNDGRVFNESAWGLLSKLYVMRARYNADTRSSDYRKAIIAFEKITTRRLVDFGHNFDLNYENNDESVFEFQASHFPNQDDPLGYYFGGTVGGMGAYYHYYTAEWYSLTCGPTQKLLDAFEPGDPRIDETFVTYPCLDEDFIKPPLKNRWGYYKCEVPWRGNESLNVQMLKYINPSRSWFEQTWGISSTNNFRIIRYADVKLMAAEAYLQTGAAGKALAQVNDVRKRARESAKGGVLSVVPADLPVITMQDIMDERLRELCGEDGNRWTDLRGWHRANYINLGMWTTRDFGYEYNAVNFAFNVGTHLLFPIPKSEMEVNPKMAASGNNPGY